MAEATISVVQLPNDKEGKIITERTQHTDLETLTGVDLIIDDTPEAVILSAFDQSKEVARIVLEN